MDCDVTLTAAEFSKAHNAMFYLESSVAALKNTIHPDHLKTLTTSIEQLREAFAGAYAQEDRSFRKKSAHYDEIAEKNGFVTSSWSMREADDLTQPHPWQGAKVVSYPNNWGLPTEFAIEGKTWVDLWRAAELCIAFSGDKHHIFIENFTPVGDTLVLSTGS
jgi:hypothetical protein